MYVFKYNYTYHIYICIRAVRFHYWRSYTKNSSPQQVYPNLSTHSSQAWPKTRLLQVSPTSESLFIKLMVLTSICTKSPITFILIFCHPLKYWDPGFESLNNEKNAKFQPSLEGPWSLSIVFGMDPTTPSYMVSRCRLLIDLFSRSWIFSPGIRKDDSELDIVKSEAFGYTNRWHWVPLSPKRLKESIFKFIEQIGAKWICLVCPYFASIYTMQDLELTLSCNTGRDVWLCAQKKWC